MPESLKKNLPSYIVLSLFALALFLRTYRVDLMEFKWDEATAWLTSQLFAGGYYFPCGGLMSSRRIQNFPLFIYLLGIPAYFSIWPTLAVICIAVINSLLVFPLYVATRRLWNTPIACTTVLLYVISPASIFFARKLWAQDLMPAFGIGIFYLLERLTTTDNPPLRLHLFLLGFLCSTGTQVHLSVLFLTGACFFGLAMLPHKKTNFVWFFISAGVGSLFSLPWWWWQYQDLTVFWEQMQQGIPTEKAFHPLQITQFFLSQLGDAGFSQSLGEKYSAFLALNPGYLAFTYMILLVTLGGGIFCFWQGLHHWHDQDAKRKTSICFIFPSVALGGLLLSRTPVYSHYFSAFYPYPFLFAGIALGTLHEHIKKLSSPRRKVSHPCFFLLLTAMLFLQLGYVYRFVDILIRY
ncbi:TPA: hypothetical protein DDW35_09590, partial [Candidatus Sumerlaeota bacterium]|nr:hypothetical protein [Candidatus Sumerlaeota bacterium]